MRTGAACCRESMKYLNRVAPGRWARSAAVQARAEGLWRHLISCEGPDSVAELLEAPLPFRLAFTNTNKTQRFTSVG
ncbi:unnamed protein product [Bubo scandiacus]